MNVIVLIWKSRTSLFKDVIGVYSSEELSLQAARELEEENPDYIRDGYWIHQPMKFEKN